jgi:SAM-dependent methyltransferase
MQAIKALLKRLLPDPIIRWVRMLKSERHYRRYAGRGPEEIFTYIYRNRLWGGEGELGFRSGTGSLPEHSRAYEDYVVALAKRLAIRSILDVGCGDFQVSRRILDRLGPDVSYTGIDVVPELIRRNAERHGSTRIRFEALRDGASYPEADLVLIRQVLQHNENRAAAAILERARRAGRWILIAEHVPLDPNTPNLDIRTGHETRIDRGSGLFVDLPPFGLPVEEIRMFAMDAGTALRVTLSRGERA